MKGRKQASGNALWILVSAHCLRPVQRWVDDGRRVFCGVSSAGQGRHVKALLESCIHAWRRMLPANECGSTFVEVLIAVVLLGLIAAAVAPAIGYNVRASFEVKERTTAEYLTRNQVEYLKACSYVPGNATHPYPDYAMVPVPDNTYDITVAAQPIRIDPDTLAHAPLTPGEDEGIQEISVEVRHVDRVVLTSKFYKTNR